MSFLPKSDKVNKKRNKSTINLPVKNFEMYMIKILSLDIKPRKVKISGKKSWKYEIPIELMEIIPIDQDKINSIKALNPREFQNYTNIENFGKNKSCMWRVAPTHYNILDAWLIQNGIGINDVFAFERTNSGVNTKINFFTEKLARERIELVRKQKEKKDTKK